MNRSAPIGLVAFSFELGNNKPNQCDVRLAKIESFLREER